jgi:hypothetical protein
MLLPGPGLVGDAIPDMLSGNSDEILGALLLLDVMPMDELPLRAFAANSGVTCKIERVGQIK